MLQIGGCSGLDELTHSRFRDFRKIAILANLLCSSSYFAYLPEGLTLVEESSYQLKLHQVVYVTLTAVRVDTLQKFSYGVVEARIGVIRHKECLYNPLNIVGMNIQVQLIHMIEK